MKKIGLLTYHYSVNYGAVLQAYALYSFVESLGCDVEFIDYRPWQLRNSNRKYLYYRGQKLINPFLLKSGFQKNKKFSRFISKNMKLSSKAFLKHEDLCKTQHCYDAIICGSDEIWNINDSHTDFGSDLAYFLDFTDSKSVQKISYAPSFGYTKSLGKSKSRVCKLIQEFKFLSVRDSNSQRIISECGRDAQKVLDPTFLIDYSNILKIPSTTHDYILLYGSFSKKQGNYIEDFAKSMSLDIISIGARPGEYKPKYSYIGIGPEEWLGYFKEASYIFTNYFHGVIFSIIFKKPFVNFDRPGKSIKVKDLLGQLDLENRILTNENLFDLEKIALSNIKWNYSVIEELVDNSKAFISKALS